MRLFIPLVALFLIALPAEAAQNCTTAETEVAGFPSEVRHKVLSGPEAVAFAKAVGAPFPATFTYVISWVDQERYEIALVSVFGDDGCIVTRAKLPKQSIVEFIGADS